jgi:hypothetical protein
MLLAQHNYEIHNPPNKVTNTHYITLFSIPINNIYHPPLPSTRQYRYVGRDPRPHTH